MAAKNGRNPDLVKAPRPQITPKRSHVDQRVTDLQATIATAHATSKATVRESNQQRGRAVRSKPSAQFPLKRRRSSSEALENSQAEVFAGRQHAATNGAQFGRRDRRRAHRRRSSVSPVRGYLIAAAILDLFGIGQINRTGAVQPGCRQILCDLKARRAASDMWRPPSSYCLREQSARAG